MLMTGLKMSRRKQAKPNRLNEDEEEGVVMEQLNGGETLSSQLNNGDVELMDNGGNNFYGDSEDGDLCMAEVDQDLSEGEENEGNPLNNNNRMDMGEEGSQGRVTAIDIKEKLLKMNLGGLVSSDPREQLQNVGQTIEQLTGGLGKVSSPANLQELQVLQATLLSLQQQQLLQFHLLGQVQQQIGEDASPSIIDLAEKLEINNPFVNQMNQMDDKNGKLITPLNVTIQESASEELKPLTTPISKSDTFSVPPTTKLPPSMPQMRLMTPPASLPDMSNMAPPNVSFASSIITNHEPMMDKPVNTLELLQQKAQGILQSASKGILANNLADMTSTPYPGSQGAGREDQGNIKHRCRYCGKVFGSDSALGIHIRSHTGERPYKCNICGNRFTTKGNLKVHFSRHSDRFPQMKMNPNMVPEHLDKFYPAFLQQCEEAEKKGLPMPNVNNPTAGMAPIVPPGMTLPTNLPGMPALPSTPPTCLPTTVRLPTVPFGVPLPSLPIGPPKIPLTMGALPRYPLPTEPIKREDIFKERPSWLKSFPLLDRPPFEKSFELDIKREIKEERELERPPPMEVLLPQYPLPRSRLQSLSPKEIDQMYSRSGSDEEDFQEEPENLSNGKRDDEEEEEMDIKVSFMDRLRPSLPQFPVMPPHFLRPPSNGPPFSRHSSPGLQLFLPQSIDPTKDPNLYNTLLPRPGSTDNAWESLIEVDKSNETAKLESLVNNIDTKLSDANECVICHRVLSCKSALQMHYRIHTGERPFKCKICNRSFTTKGNLKTHMGVHRSKPPMRSFPQCPVCHKKFANSVVLQQHIKTHTGEKTEMSLEQIAAAEIREFPPGVTPNIPFGLPNIRPPGDPLNKFLPQFPILTPPHGMSGFEDDHSDDKNSRPSSVSSSNSFGSGHLMSTGVNASPYCTSFSASLAALEKQVRTIDSSAMMLVTSESGPSVVSSPFSNKISPETKEGEEQAEMPEDLSKPASSGMGEEEEEEEGQERASPASCLNQSPPDSDTEGSLHGDTGNINQSLTGSRSDIDSPISSVGQPGFSLACPAPALLAGPGPLSLAPMPGFPTLPGPLFPAGLVGLPFPNPLSQLAGHLPPPPGFPQFGLPFPGLRHPFMEDMFAAPRGKTTCQICFKVFACNSALEIHMRSHTKERPFKCDVCGKGFTTKGNMKQHAMTHKFGDSTEGVHYEDQQQPSPLRCQPVSPSSGLAEPMSSPVTSPHTSISAPVSPHFPSSSPSSGLKRGPTEETDVVSSLATMDHRPPEKRAILCG